MIQRKHIKQMISLVTPCSPSFKTCANWKKRTRIRWWIWRIGSALLFILWHVGLQDSFVDLVYGLLCVIQHEFDLCKLELHRSRTVCTHNEVEINDAARIWLVTSPAPSYNRLIKVWVWKNCCCNWSDKKLKCHTTVHSRHRLKERIRISNDWAQRWPNR